MPACSALASWKGIFSCAGQRSVFPQALDTYAQRHDEQIGRVMALSASLQQLISESDVSDALRESEVSLNFYLSAADRYAATFDEAIELVTELATDETGAQARLAQNSELLREALQQADDPDLMLLYREMQAFEKDYLVTRQRPSMQSAFNVAGLLREAIEQLARPWTRTNRRRPWPIWMITWRWLTRSSCSTSRSATNSTSLIYRPRPWILFRRS